MGWDDFRKKTSLWEDFPKMMTTSMDQARISVSRYFSSEYLQPKIYVPIFGWTTTSSVSESLKASYSSAPPEEQLGRILHVYKQTIHELTKISLRIFYGYEGDYDKFECQQARSVVSPPRLSGGEPFVDPLLRADTGSYSVFRSTPLHIPSKVLCLLVSASVQTSFQDSPDATPNDAKVGAQDGAKFSSWFPDPLNEETSSDAFEKVFQSTLPTVCSKRQLESDDYGETADCSVKVPLAVLNLFPRTFGRFSQDVNGLQSLVGSSTPATTNDVLQAILDFEYFVRSSLKDGDFSVYPGGSSAKTYRDWTYEVWRNIPTKMPIVPLEVNEKGEVIGDYVVYDDFEDAHIWEYSQGDDKKFEKLPNVGVFCATMEPADSPNYTQGKDGELVYNDQMVLLAPIGDPTTGTYSNSCGWLPIFFEGNLEAVATAQFLKAFSRQKREAQNALQRTISMNIELTLSIEVGISKEYNPCAGDDLLMMTGVKDASTINIAHLPDGKLVAAYVPGVENEHVNLFFGIAGNPLSLLPKSQKLPEMTVGFEVSRDFTEESTSFEFALEVSIPESIIEKAFPPSEAVEGPIEEFINRKFQTEAGQAMLVDATTITGNLIGAIYTYIHHGFHTSEAEDTLGAEAMAIPVNVGKIGAAATSSLSDLSNEAESALGNSKIAPTQLKKVGEMIVAGFLAASSESLAAPYATAVSTSVKATMELQIVVKRIKGGEWAIDWEKTFANIKVGKTMSMAPVGMKVKLEYVRGTKLSLVKAKELAPRAIPPQPSARTGRLGVLSHSAQETGARNLLTTSGSRGGRLTKENGVRNLLEDGSAIDSESPLPTGIAAFKQKVARHKKRTALK
jgi:hypothetical protein